MRCREQYVPTSAELERLYASIPTHLFRIPDTLYRAVGCELCNNTGYGGRQGVHEVLEIHEPIRDAILRKASAEEIRSIALSYGMVPMIADGYAKVLQGDTSLMEILRMCYV